MMRFKAILILTMILASAYLTQSTVFNYGNADGDYIHSSVEDFGLRTSSIYNRNTESVYALTPSEDKKIEIEIVLLLDVSDSMGKIPGNWSTIKAEVLKNNTHLFIDGLQESGNISMGIVEFERDSYIRMGLTTLKSDYDKQLVKNAVTGDILGYTNLGKGIETAVRVLSNSTSNSSKKVIFVVSDGKPTHPGPDPREYAFNVAKAAKESGIIIACALLPFKQVSYYDLEYMMSISSKISYSVAVLSNANTLISGCCAVNST